MEAQDLRLEGECKLEQFKEDLQLVGLEVALELDIGLEQGIVLQPVDQELDLVLIDLKVHNINNLDKL